MKNNEIKNYKDYTIKKENNNSFIVNGFLNKFKTYDDAKKSIDMAASESQALNNIDMHVQNVCGGWL